MDYVGGANYPKRIINHHPEGMGIGILDRASGWPKGIPILDDILVVRDDVKHVRISGIWHDGHWFDRGDIRPAVRIGKRVAKFSDKHPDIQVWFQPWLEPRCLREHANILVARLKKKLPEDIIIVFPGFCTKRVIDEAHHSMNGKYGAIHSFDGSHMHNVPQFKEHYKKIGCPMFGGWEPCFNGLESLTDDTDRNKRTNYPRKKDFKYVERKLREK
jgi:hypothetical protein